MPCAVPCCVADVLVRRLPQPVATHTPIEVGARHEGVRDMVDRLASDSLTWHS